MQLTRFFNSGNAACVAALLVAVGLEVDQVLVKHILDVIAGIVAIIGFIGPVFGE